MQFVTGRNYGTPQVLLIEVLSPLSGDSIAMVLVRFVDKSRGISGTVKLMEFELDQIGPAVLREYDSGRYGE